MSDNTNRNRLVQARISRRTLLRGMLAGSGVSLLAACGAAPAASPTAAPETGGSTTEGSAMTVEPGTVIVATWGGDYQRLLGENIEQPVLGPLQVTVTHDIGDVPTRKTKLRAEKDSAEGSLDVVHFGGADMYEVYQEGLLLELDPARIPNWSNINSAFVTPYSIPHIYSAQVILYNSEQVNPPPDSYEVFWDPQYQGRVGILETNWTQWLEIAAQLNGGSATDYEPGKAKLMDLKANEPQIFPSQETLAAALQGGDVWLTPNWRARGVMWQNAGMPISTAVPKEGAVPILFLAAIPKNAPNLDRAYAYLDAMLDPTAQLGFGDQMGYIPTVTNADLSEEMAATLGFTTDDQANFFQQDFDYIAASQSDWQEWWQQEFLA